jgi:hypothetical protein
MTKRKARVGLKGAGYVAPPLGIDADRLTEEERERVAQWHPLAMYIARKWSRKFPHLWEFIHDQAVNGLLEAARRYDEGRGVFRNCAWAYVEGAIRNGLRHDRKALDRGHYEITGATAAAPDGDPLMELVPCPEDPDYEAPEFARWLVETAARLDEAYPHDGGLRARVFLYCGADDAPTLKEIGRREGLSRERIRQVKDDIRALLSAGQLESSSSSSSARSMGSDVR